MTRYNKLPESRQRFLLLGFTCILGDRLSVIQSALTEVNPLVSQCGTITEVDLYAIVVRINKNSVFKT